jgi:hypothetical protein
MAKQTGGAGTRKFGRDNVKCAAYRAHQQREKNKLPRILRSNGIEYAMEWAKKNGVIALLNKLVIR